MFFQEKETPSFLGDARLGLHRSCAGHTSSLYFWHAHHLFEPQPHTPGVLFVALPTFAAVDDVHAMKTKRLSNPPADVVRLIKKRAALLHMCTSWHKVYYLSHEGFQPSHVTRRRSHLVLTESTRQKLTPPRANSRQAHRGPSAPSDTSAIR